jgi:hypothetical protein
MAYISLRTTVSAGTDGWICIKFATGAQPVAVPTIGNSSVTVAEIREVGHMDAITHGVMTSSVESRKCNLRLFQTCAVKVRAICSIRMADAQIREIGR